MTAVSSPPPGRPRTRALLRDGLISGVVQPVASITAATVVAMVCLVVLLTTGRSAAAEREVMDSIDSIGTRLITVTDATGTSAIDASSVAEIAQLPGVTWAFGLGPATDGRNADLQGSIATTPMRPLVGDLPPEVGVPTGRAPSAPHEAVVGGATLGQLHLGDIAGALTDGTTTVGVVGKVDGSGALSFLDDLVLYRADAKATVPLRLIYLLVDDATTADQTARDVTAVLHADHPDQVEVSTSAGVIQLQRVIAGSLGASARKLMAGVLAVGLLLVTVTMLGAVSSRRRDFGRRRALGASRSAIVVIVLVQSAFASIPGAIVGSIGGMIGVHLMTGSAPSTRFTVGVAALAVLVALVGSAPPAIMAARRDPLRILRVP